MLQQIAMWGGIAGIAVALFAIIILYLTRKNILDILNKDVILFDKNFELKKIAINNALKIIDELEQFGQSITLQRDFEEKAKSTYNDLLCVVSDVRVADEFYNLTLDKNTEITEIRFASFKLACRKDIGLSTKHAKIVKRTTNKEPNSMGTNETVLKTNSLMGDGSSFSGSASAFSATPTPREKEDISYSRSVQPSMQAQQQRPSMPTRPTAPTQARPMPRPQTSSYQTTNQNPTNPPKNN